MTDEHKELMEKFDEIKSVATEKKKELPKGYYDSADVHYFYALSSLFQLGRTGAYSDEDVEKHCVWLCNKYIADKAVSERNKQICSQNHKRRMCCSELLTKLVKTADMLADSEIIDICVEIIEKGFDEITGNQIRKKLAQRSENNMLLVLKDEYEAIIYNHLVDCCRLKNDVAMDMCEAAKKNGMAGYSGYMIRQNNEDKKRFSLYRIPGVIL